MLNVTGFALDKSRLTIAVILLIIMAGFASFLTFARQEDPPIVIREALIVAFFPGMIPEQMEDLVTRRIEEEIRTMPEIDEITSETKTGSVIIHAVTRDEYDGLEAIWKRLRNKMDDVRPKLPDGTIGPIVYDEFGLTAVATIALWSEGFTMAEMRLVARDVRDRLYELDGIRKVELFGVQEEQVFLKFSNAKLSQFGITPGEVVRTLRRQNIILPGGNIDAEGRSVIVSPSGNYRSVKQIEDTLIAIPDTQQMVRLKDLVTVERGYADPPDSLAFFNGRPTIVISVSIIPGVNSVEFGQRLKEKVAGLEAEQPWGYKMDFATFQPDLVVVAVDGALNNVYQTLGIVLVVVMLFLGVRSGLIVGSFVPIAMLLGLLVMSQFGIELERVSIVSAIVALGMLVDNAIVVTEDIRARLERGQERRAACTEAGSTLAVPLLTSSLTTILAFMPMLLIDGQTGEYAYSLPMVVIILLLGSWFLSLYMTPAMCFWFVKVKPAKADQDSAADPYATGFYRYYRGLLETALRGRYLVIAITVALLVAAGYAAKEKLVREFFGPSDRNQFLVYVDLPAGSRVTETEEVIRRLAAWLSDPDANPEISSNIAYVGTGGPRFFLSLSPVDPDPHVAFLVVNTETADQAPEVIRRVRQHLLDSFPSVSARVKRMWLGANEPATVDYRLIGTDAEFLFEKSRQLVEALWQVEGIDYVHNDWQNREVRVEVLVDQSRARRAGVTSEEVALSLKSFIDGATLTDYREGDLAIPIVLQAVDEERQALGDLWNISVYSGSRGENVPLTQIADIVGNWQLNRIARKDQERTVTIQTRHQFLKAPQLYDKMLPVLAELGMTLDTDLYLDSPLGGRIAGSTGARWELGGEIEDSAETNEKLFRYLPHCILLIVVLLIWQFNSFRRPSIIMLTIPMAFAGALVGVIVMGAPFDFFGTLGLLSLAGVIINNGIVLIDRMDSEREKDQSAYQAVVSAAVSRFRPILMSAITTMLGVAPLIVFKDPLFYSMACVIAFGLALGTVLSLLVVPVLYVLFMRIKIA